MAGLTTGAPHPDVYSLPRSSRALRHAKSFLFARRIAQVMNGAGGDSSIAEGHPCEALLRAPPSCSWSPSGMAPRPEPHLDDRRDRQVGPHSSDQERPALLGGARPAGSVLVVVVYLQPRPGYHHGGARRRGPGRRRRPCIAAVVGAERRTWRRSSTSGTRRRRSARRRSLRCLGRDAAGADSLFACGRAPESDPLARLGQLEDAGRSPYFSRQSRSTPR